MYLEINLREKVYNQNKKIVFSTITLSDFKTVDSSFQMKISSQYEFIKGLVWVSLLGLALLVAWGKFISEVISRLDHQRP